METASEITEATTTTAAETAAPVMKEASTETTGEHQLVDPNGGKTEQPAPDIMSFLTSPMFLLLIGVWALFIFSSRKQKKKAQERKDQLSSIKKGDKVVTIGRVHGEVVSMTEKTITLKVDPKGSTLTFDREAVLAVPSQEKQADVAEPVGK